MTKQKRTYLAGLGSILDTVSEDTEDTGPLSIFILSWLIWQRVIILSYLIFLDHSKDTILSYSISIHVLLISNPLWDQICLI